jgi:hypothetical protein
MLELNGSCKRQRAVPDAAGGAASLSSSLGRPGVVARNLGTHCRRAADAGAWRSDGGRCTTRFRVYLLFAIGSEEQVMVIR